MFIRKTDDLVRGMSTLFCSSVRKAARRKVNWTPGCVCGSWTPEAAKNRSVSRWVCNALRRCFFEEMTWGRELNVWKMLKFILQSNSETGTQRRPVCCFFVFLGNLSRSSEEMGKRCTRVKLVKNKKKTALLFTMYCVTDVNLQMHKNRKFAKFFQPRSRDMRG